MTQLPPTPSEPQLHPADEGDLFDWSALRRWATFVLRSVTRHRVAALVVVAGVLVMTGIAAKWAPRKYQSEARLLANRNQMMAILGNPHRNMPTDQDTPTRAATETVMARDNLESMIQQTRLLEHWEANRNPLLRFKDQLMRMLTGPLSEEERLEIMVSTMERRLSVFSVDQTVVIRIDWPDPQMARQLVETAQQNFLEARHVQEVSAISEAISILEMHAAETQTGIEEAIKQVQAVSDERKKGAKGAVPRPRPVAVANNEAPQQELAQLKFLIRTKRRSLSDLEEFRARRLTELNAQLAEQRVIYSANHPTVVDMEQRIGALQKESPQVVQLKRDEEQLIAEYKGRGGRDVVNLSDLAGGAPRATSSSPVDLDAALSSLMPSLDEDPAMLVARDQLRMATARYQDLLMRIDAARIELDTARAAFKYRYSVVSPALTPRKPISPNVSFIILGGVLGAIACAFLASTLLDLKGGRLIEAWQVEAQLGVPVLTELKSRRLG
jgi:uncharacterized protein involved in exopolysaccharide biosynthesis